MGDMGSAVVRGTAGGGSVLGEPLAGGICGVAGAGEGDGTEPDAVGFPASDACRGSERGERGESGVVVAAGDIWRGGAGISELADVVEEISGRAEAGEYVRNYGDHGACDLPGDRT